MSTPPKLDPRTAEDIAQQIRDLLAQTPISTPLKPDDKTIEAALVGIFARFAELIIQRLNQVPDKNFLAFLDLLGASRLPPQPARVPLTFSLAPGSVQAVVPPGTQVAAPPAVGEKDPVIFETERELVVTAAQLASVFVRDPEQDFYADYSPVALQTAGNAASAASLDVPIFRGNRAIAHILYVGQSDLFDLPDVSLDSPQVQTLTLTINLTRPLGDGGQLQWQVWDGKTWKDKRPGEAPNNASNLAIAGDCQIIFSPSFNQSEIKAVPLSKVASEESRWLRCFLKPDTPITNSATPQTGRVRVAQLPLINSIRFRLSIAPPTDNPSPLAIDAAFLNQLPIDLTQPFFPFGEKPKFGDTFYLANREAFSKSGAAITLQINLTNLVDLSITPTGESVNPSLRLQWEYWDNTVWKPIGLSNRLDPGTPNADYASNFKDNTLAFTQREHSAPSVKFNLPSKLLKATIVNGIENFWIRVRIVAGDYGKEATYVPKSATSTQPASYDFKPASFAPPVIGSLKVGYMVIFDKSAPDKILTYNDFAYRIVKPEGVRFPPFNPTPDQPSLYLGFVVPIDLPFPNRPISLFVQAADVKYGEDLAPVSPTTSRQVANPGNSATHTFTLTNPTAAAITFNLSLSGMRSDWNTMGVPPTLVLGANSPQTVKIQVAIPSITALGSRDRGILKLKSDESDLTYSATFETIARSALPTNQRLQLSWQYWNGIQWTKLSVQDGSENFTRSGLVEFLPPADIALREEFDQPPRYWLRVRWESGDYDLEPRLQRILLNTTIAAQTVTLHNEILGSSDGTEDQRFRATRSPILHGQQLEVREPERPSAQERLDLEAKEGLDAIPPDLLGSSRDVWVRWHEVSDFYQSHPRSRHYVLDRLTGEIRVGNGINGLVPPIGVGNLRLIRYQTGGGTAGNQPPGAIVQLKTTVPYVDQVTNPIAAAGGANAESLDSLRDRVPRELRHSHRAVTLEDYEDLAMLASPEVARAKCVPLLNLRQNPQAVQNPAGQPPKAPGSVSVIIVPRSRLDANGVAIDAKPLPSLELISRVQAFLTANSSPTVDLFVVGPLYIRVDVTAEIALTSLEGSSTVKQAVEQTLASFLHPLTGGFDNAGWAFGREPHLSDFYARIEAIPGVDYVRTLSVRPPPYPPGIKETDRFLVYSGNPVITLFFDPD